MNPALSPDGEKIVFSRMSPGGLMRTWIMPLSTGEPVRLNDSVDRVEFAGAWSPDGARFAQIEVGGGKRDLAISKVGSRAAPVILRRNIEGNLPAWSPASEWIAYRDENGWGLISNDEKRPGLWAKSRARISHSQKMESFSMEFGGRRSIGSYSVSISRR
ncbi:MAG: hypothetical protein M3Y27_01585 [Acidobacteriota bacterium]|nr:hypothetical protein [Acidobacteriota bacterium]